MIKGYEAITNEIDDVEKAVAEILEQLAPMKETAAGTNAVGILSCYAEYVDSGVVRALCEQLPFDVIGTTTIASSSCAEIGDVMLSLLVITSDDVRFVTAMSDPLAEEEEAPLRSCYESALEKLGEKPVFMMSFFPLLTNISGDYYVDRMSEISGNLPNFGTFSVDHTSDYRDSMVILNGEASRERLAVLLFAGNVSPSFFVGNISDSRVFPEKGVVTGSQGNLLHSVNNMSAVDYFQSLGLRKNEDGTISGINTFPLIMDYGDNTQPIVRAIFATTPEGHVVCGGNVPVGSIITLGTFDPDEIVATTVRTVETAVRGKDNNILIVYSCIGRYFAQGLDQAAEMSRTLEAVGDVDVSYLAAYAGGEICPVNTADGTMVNRNHNVTVIVCTF